MGGRGSGSGSERLSRSLCVCLCLCLCLCVPLSLQPPTCEDGEHWGDARVARHEKAGGEADAQHLGILFEEPDEIPHVIAAAAAAAPAAAAAATALLSL